VHGLRDTPREEARTSPSGGQVQTFSGGIMAQRGRETQQEQGQVGPCDPSCSVSCSPGKF